MRTASHRHCHKELHSHAGAQGGHKPRRRRAAGQSRLAPPRCHMRAANPPTRGGRSDWPPSSRRGASGRLLRRACDEPVDCCAGVRRSPSARGESAWESMGWWQGWAGAHRCSSMTMSAHEDVVATVVLLLVHMPGSSSGSSSSARCAIDHLEVERVAPTRRHLHGWMELRELHPTMGFRLAADGLRGLQPRRMLVLTLLA